MYLGVGSSLSKSLRIGEKIRIDAVRGAAIIPGNYICQMSTSIKYSYKLSG